MKTIILGMNSPNGVVLQTDLRGASGGRLLNISGLSAAAFSAAFERMNLLRTKDWLPDLAAPSAAKLIDEIASGPSRTVVVLGRDVWRALRFPEIDWCRSIEVAKSEWFSIPHPSGKCHWYNEKANVMRARRVLRVAASAKSS